MTTASSTRPRRILDQWEDLDGIADRATELCQALDQWRGWADGADLTRHELTSVVRLFAACTQTQEIEVLSQTFAASELAIDDLGQPGRSADGLQIEM